MKQLIFCAAIATLLYSCKPIQYVPIESTKIEYRNSLVHDSVLRYDSIFVKQKGDTVFFEQYRYRYRDKIVHDSIFKSDTIHVPYPVQVIKQIKAPLTGWQNFQVWCGRILLVIVFFVGLYFILRFKKIQP